MTDVIKLSPVAEESSFPATYFNLANEHHFWCRGRIEAFYRLATFLGIPLGKPLHILDVGCGNGVVRKQIENRTAWITDGADLNFAALAQNDLRQGNTYYYNIFDLYKAFHNKYDMIMLFDVLEHIDQPAPFLQALSYHVKPGGWIFINVPALEWFMSAYDTVQGHIRRYNKQGLREVLTDSPLQPRSLAYWGISLVPLAIARKVYAGLLHHKTDILTRGFKPPFPFMNALLSGLLKIEIMLCAHPPLGTSLMCAAQKRQ